MSDTYLCKEARCHHQVELLNLSESDFDHSSQRARYDNYKNCKELEVIGPIDNRYREVLDFCTYHLSNTSS